MTLTPDALTSDALTPDALTPDSSAQATTLASAAAGARRLATVETITEIRDIPDADAIVCARVRGWDVVVKRGEFAPGDACVYFEVDAMLDVNRPEFAFLAPRGVRTDATGLTGHVLKTAKLRGQYSQGLALPLATFPDHQGAVVGSDLTDVLVLAKWDPPIPASLAGSVRGRRPGWIPATDEERIQNVPEILEAQGEEWIATEKIDGTSTTFYLDPENPEYPGGVCSRNLDLLEEAGSTLWRLARELDIHAHLAAAWPGLRVALSGETYGEGVQGNPLRLKGQHFAAFTLRVGGRELARADWPEWLLDISVPVRPELVFPADLDEALIQVESLVSVLADRPAEGVVWRSLNTAQVPTSTGVLRGSFKVISRRYLLKNDR